MKTVGLLLMLMALGYIQNMTFTWSSRTRNQNDVKHHRYAAWCSNSVWYLMQVTIWGTLWKSLTTGDWTLLIATGIAYTISTTEGSVKMMDLMIRRGR